MFFTPAHIENETAVADLERAGERLVVLRRLAQLGMDLAQALRDRVVEGVEAPLSNLSGPDPALSFARVARAVRQGLALEVRLEEERRALGERTEAAAVAARAEAVERAEAERLRQVQARNRAVWKVLRPEIEDATGQGDDAGDDDYDDDDEFYALTGALHERLTDAADRDDFLMRPVESIIDEIRQALGLGALQDAASDTDALHAATRRARSQKARAPLTCADVEAAWRRAGEGPVRVESG